MNWERRLRRLPSKRGVALAWLGLAGLGVARVAHADVDVRIPWRFGFAYTGITRGPAASFSFGLEGDVLPITRRLSLQLVFDADIASRLDLPDMAPASGFTSLAAGAGLFYVTEGDVGLGFDGTGGPTFDATQIAGGGLGVRAWVYPYYLRMSDVVGRTPKRFAVLAASSIALWAMARVDWTSDGRGGTVGFGVSLDVARIFFVPYVEVLTSRFK